jgi:hypothetical protein
MEGPFIAEATLPFTFSDDESTKDLWPSTQLELAERTLNSSDFTTAAPVEVSIGPDAAFSQRSVSAELHEERAELVSARRRNAIQLRHIPVSSVQLEAENEGLASWVQELEDELGPGRALRAWPTSFLQQRVETRTVVGLLIGGGCLMGMAALWRVHVNARDNAAVRIQAAYRGSAERTSILSAVNAEDENDLRERLVEGGAS